MSNIDMKVPEVGESISEVVLAGWLKADGDYVELDESICELESDKATFEVPAEASGILRIIAQEGDTLEIGAMICKIEAKDKAVAPEVSQEATAPVKNIVKTAESSEPKATGEVFEMKIPTTAESITEVTISSWFKEDGDFVELDEMVCEIESDKAAFEMPAEARGILRIVTEEGETIPVGTIFCKVEIMKGGEAADSQVVEAGTAPENAAVRGSETYASGHPSPAAAKILAEKGLTATDVKGTGVDGRITKEDAQAAKKANPQAAKTPTKAATPVQETTPVAGSRTQRREKMSTMRRTIARRLVAVKNETAMLTTFNEVDMGAIFDLRKSYKEKFKEKHEIGLGFMSFFTKACCIALQEFPGVNASIDGKDILYNDYCDVSIAVSSPRGLVVPVIRNAEDLSFAGIEKEVRRLAIKARDGKLSIPEMMGGTFTITNGGIFGSMLSTPIINAPQSAILGMHNIVDRPMAVNGEVKIRPIMYVALSYDHRIVDGKESVSFLFRVKELLENPTRMLLYV
jgi:2-oxoglutarate dehydrogenase E2 component (dihydrolipoamide succinyltransferase)